MTSRSRYSDTAHQYARDVANGTILASKWLKLAAQKHLDDLSNTDSRWFYDAKRADRVCSFIESLKLADGSPFILQPWQMWLTCSLMGFVDEAGTRKHIEALILVPKGNGKSPWAAAMGLWFAFMDNRPQAEIYCGAVSLAQAMEVFKPALGFVESQSAFNELGVQALKKSIFTLGGSFFQPIIGKGRHGARPYLAILDELHQAISSDLYGTLKTGCNKTPNSLMMVISTAGVASTQNTCYQLQQDAQKVLEGTLPNDRLFAAIYCADESVEWNSDEALRMANPNLGISNDAEKLRIAIDDALRSPAHANNIKAMHLNIWSSASAAWMNMSKWQACADTTLTVDKLNHLPCWIGSDLASKLDLSAVIRLFRDDSQGDRPHYYAITRCYLPEERVNDPALTYYAKWAKQGHLTATDGSSMDERELAKLTIADAAGLKVERLCYDKRYADTYSLIVSEELGVDRLETPPSPAVLSPAMKELEAAVYDGRFHFDGSPLLTWCMSNVLTKETAAGNYTMPDKPRQDAKIDAAVALFLATVEAMKTQIETSADFGFIFV